MRIPTAVPSLLLFVAACSMAASPSAPAEEPVVSGKVAAASDMMAVRAQPGPAAASIAPEARRQGDIVLPSMMIIRTGQVMIEVDSLDRAIRLVAEAATAAGGFLANTSIQTGQNAPRTATLEVKVPSDRYQSTLDRLNPVGKITSATTTAQDVGEEFVDVSARVSNARKLEDRLIGLLASRTGKLDDVLAVERELARVREEIERYEGRIRYLKAQVSMSTIAITVFEPVPLVGDPGENVLVQALQRSWRNFVAVIAGGIAMAGGLIPVVVLAGLGILVIRAGWRRFRPVTGTVSGS